MSDSPRIYLSPPHMGPAERELLLQAFDSNWIAPLGPHVDAFERELADIVGVPHAAALSSGTAALHLALLMLGVGPGDRVLVATQTFAATANAVKYVGAEPVFVDSHADTWTIDPALVAEALHRAERKGQLPKAVIAVDLYGQCADYDALQAVCEPYGVPIIEDAAESLGATYKGRPAGSFGEMAAFSFNGNKIITTSGGGMLVAHRKEWIDQARFLATQAREPAPHYQHEVVGYNYRLSNLLAAVGRGQLRVLEERVAARQAIRARYQEAFADRPGLSFMPEADYGTSNAWLTCILIDPDEVGVEAEVIRQRLESLNIECRPTWKPMHQQPVFAGCEVVGGAVSDFVFERGLCLPSGSGMTEEELERVVAAVRGR